MRTGWTYLLLSSGQPQPDPHTRLLAQIRAEQPRTSDLLALRESHPPARLQDPCCPCSHSGHTVPSPGSCRVTLGVMTHLLQPEPPGQRPPDRPPSKETTALSFGRRLTTFTHISMHSTCTHAVSVYLPRPCAELNTWEELNMEEVKTTGSQVREMIRGREIKTDTSQRLK